MSLRRSAARLPPRGSILLVAPARLDGLLACPDCDLLSHRVAVPRAGRAFCPRCGALLFRHRVRAMERTLATSLGALVCLIATLTLPFLQLHLAGQIQTASLADCVRRFAEHGSPSMAALVGVTGIVIPALLVGGLIHLSLALHLGRSFPALASMARVLGRLQPWAMAEVFLLGMLVAMLKLAGEFEIVYGSGFFAYAGFVLLLTASLSSYDAETAWRLIDAGRRRRPRERAA